MPKKNPPVRRTPHNSTSTTTAQPPSQPEPLLVTIPTAARMLSATVWAIRTAIWAKQLPYVRIGHRHLIDPADLRAFIGRQKGGE